MLAVAALKEPEPVSLNSDCGTVLCISIRLPDDALLASLSASLLVMRDPVRDDEPSYCICFRE